MVQFDDHAPIRLSVSRREPVRRECVRDGVTEAALASLNHVHCDYDSGTAGGPFAIWNSPAPMVRAATAEIVKPPSVRSVTVWLDDCVQTSVRLSLQYLDSSQSVLSESSFLALKTIANSAHSDARSRRFAQQELENDSWSVEQLLRSHHDAFTVKVAPSEDLQPIAELWDHATLDNLHQQAVRAIESARYYEAIAFWTGVIRHSEGERRRNAILSRANALVTAGEDTLARQELRGWLRFSNDEKLKSAAALQLLDQAETSRERETILAFAAIETTDEMFELELARQLADNGRYRKALVVLSIVQPDQENCELFLRCCYQTQWWRLFDRALATCH